MISALLRSDSPHRFRLYVRDAAGAADVTLEALGIEGGDAGRFDVVPIRRRRLWTHLGLGLEITWRPPDALFVPAHVLPATLAWPRRMRAAVTIHDVGFRHFPSAQPWRPRLYLDWSTAFAGWFADVLIADSEATRRDLRHFYRVPAGRIRVAYPGPVPVLEVSDERRRAILHRCRIGEGRPYVLHVGTRQPRKNLRRLLRAWREVVDRLPQAGEGETPATRLSNGAAACPSPVLVLAGAEGWGGEDLQAQAAELGLDAVVRFAGYLSDADKAALLRGASALAFPSLHEGFGLPVLEAQSVGVPVVCSNSSALPEVAGDAAVYVNPMDASDIARGLLAALNDTAARDELVRAGYRNVKRFSWDACARVVLDALAAGRPLPRATESRPA